MQELLTIHLLTTLGCHLCEDAEAMLLYYREQHGLAFELTHVEITENEELLENYGVRIPVLQHSINGLELAWPFDMEQLATFLQSA